MLGGDASVEVKAVQHHAELDVGVLVHSNLLHESEEIILASWLTPACLSSQRLKNGLSFNILCL